MSTHFNIYSIILLIFPACLLILVIMQILSDEFAKKQSIQTGDNKTRIRLYLVYLSGMFCGVIGYSLHATVNVHWCETFGFLPCFLFLGLSKACLYLFFLRRAELAQGLNITKCKTIFFRYIGPCYLMLYWLIYIVLTTIVFSGKLVKHHNELSNCVFATGAWWFSVFAGCVDIFNTIISLIIFVQPLLNAMNNLKQTESEYYDEDHIRYVSMMKYNIFLALIAAISSVVSVFLFYTMQEFVWLFCLGDPAVNGMCTFFMIAPNRNFLKHLCTSKRKKTMEMRKTQMVVMAQTTSSNSTIKPNIPIV
eukprot:68351_1